MLPQRLRAAKPEQVWQVARPSALYLNDGGRSGPLDVLSLGD